MLLLLKVFEIVHICFLQLRYENRRQLNVVEKHNFKVRKKLYLKSREYLMLPSLWNNFQIFMILCKFSQKMTRNKSHSCFLQSAIKGSDWKMSRDIFWEKTQFDLFLQKMPKLQNAGLNVGLFRTVFWSNEGITSPLLCQGIYATKQSSCHSFSAKCSPNFPVTFPRYASDKPSFFSLFFSHLKS